MKLNNAKRLSFEHEFDCYELEELKRKNILYDCSNYYVFYDEFIIDLEELEYTYGGDIN